MRALWLASALTATGLSGLGVMPGVASAQDSGGLLFPPASERQDVQRVAVDATEVGITDVVQRQAIGTLEDLSRELHITDPVFFNEMIETGPDSATRVTFLDNTSLSLGESSRVIIDRFVYDPSTSTGDMAMSLSTGVFRFASGAIDDANYRIEAPNATIGIRGTDFYVETPCDVIPREECPVSVDVNDGRVAMNTALGNVEAEAGNRIVFDPTLGPPRVVPIAPDTPALPGVAEMNLRIRTATLDLIDGALPPGVPLQQATGAEVSDAARDLATANPAVSDLVAAAIRQSRPELADQVDASLRQVPGAAARLDQSSLEEISPGAGPGGRFRLLPPGQIGPSLEEREAFRGGGGPGSTLRAQTSIQSGPRSAFVSGGGGSGSGLFQTWTSGVLNNDGDDDGQRSGVQQDPVSQSRPSLQ